MEQTRRESAAAWAAQVNAGDTTLQLVGARDDETADDVADRTLGVRARIKVNEGPDYMWGVAIALPPSAQFRPGTRGWAPAQITIRGDALHGTQGRRYTFMWSFRDIHGIHWYDFWEVS